MVKLGDKVYDTISGFEGIATGRSEYLNGCITVCVEGPFLKDKAERNEVWFDEQRLAVRTRDAFIPLQSEARAGGPVPTPPRDGI